MTQTAYRLTTGLTTRLRRLIGPSLFGMVLVGGASGCNDSTGTATGSSAGSGIAEELKTMDAAERQALTDLLKGTGVTAEQLRSIGIRGIDRNARAIAIEGGHVIGLRLSNVTLADLTPLARLGALQALWLTDCGLTSVAGIADLPQLTDLNLDGNQLTSLAALRGLPALKKLSARNNKLTEKPGVGLPAKLTLTLDGNPLGQAPVAAASPASPAAGSAAVAATGGVVPQLPKATGKGTGKGPHSLQGTLGSNTPFVASGVYDTLNGAISLRLLKAESIDPTVDAEVSVDAGRVRIYLEEEDRKNFRFVEASPGKPARLRGRMVFDIGQFGTYLESVEGQATMVRYRLSRPGR